MTFNPNLKRTAKMAAAALLMFAATPASALTASFVNIFPSDPTDPVNTAVDPFVGNFLADIDDLGGNMVRFSFSNSGSQGFIGDVYIEDSLGLLGNDYAVNDGNVGGVNFRDHNPNLPQGNEVGFDGDFGYKFSGGSGNGVHEDETLGVKFNNVSFASIVQALLDGDLRLGMHIQGLANGASDSIVNGVNPVPLPAPLVLAGFALGVLGWMLRPIRGRSKA